MDLDAIKTRLGTTDLCGGPGSKEEMRNRAVAAVQGVVAAETDASGGEDNANFDQYCEWAHSYDNDQGVCCLMGTFGNLGCGQGRLKPVVTTS